MRSHQPQPRQQGGSNDMQLLQQQLMCKQLQELQRQQQLQQFNQVSRQNNSASQFSTGAKPAAANQLPAFLNGMPIGNASNCMRLDEFVGGESKPSICSQMFAGNINWGQPNESSAMYGFSNGLALPNEQDQAIRSMGSLARHHSDQSLYGTPVSTSSASLDQYAHFQRTPNPSGDVIQRSGGNRSSQRDYPVFTEQDPAEDGIVVAKQGFQGKSLFMNAPNQDQVSRVMPEQIPQEQKTRNMQHKTDWSGSLQEKAVLQAGVSGGVPCLDPAEEKLLFGTDNDANWLAFFRGGGNSSTGVHLHSNTLGENDSFGGSFPSIHSGSWSALMLDALDVTSSEMGVQEEWSGPSFHKTEHSTSNRSSAPNDNANQHAFSLSSRPVHHFMETEASPSCHAAPTVQPSTRFSCEPNDHVSSNALEGSSQQSSREAEIKHFDQGYHQVQFVEGGFKIPMQSGISPAGAWGGRMYEQSSCAPGDLNLPNMTRVWVDQQNQPSSNVNSSQPNHKQSIWHTNGTMVPGTNDTSAFHASHDRQLHAQKGDMNGTMNTVGDHDGSIRSSGLNRISSTVRLETSESHTGSPTMRSQRSCLSSFAAASDNSNPLERKQEMNQNEFNIPQVNFGRNVSADPYAKARADKIAGKIQHQPDSEPQDWDSSIKGSTKGVRDVQEPSLPKGAPNEGCSTHPSNSGKLADSRNLARENIFFSGSGPDHFIRGNQKNIGQPGQKAVGSHRLQYHPMGNLAMNIEPADGLKQTSYSQNLAQLQELKNLDQRHIGQSQFGTQIVSNNAIMGKEQVNDSERKSKGPQETQSTSFISNSDLTKSASFDQTAGLGPQNKRMGQPSQNMLELLQKVDQSRDQNSTQLDFPYSGRQPEITKAAASDGSAFNPQYNQSSALQGFGLRLALSSQRQSVANHVLPSQASSHDPTASSHCLLHADEPSQKENSDNNSSISGQPGKGTPHSHTYLNSSCTQQQEQGRQNRSTAFEYEAVDQSADVSSDVDPQDKRASVHGIYNGNTTDVHQADASQFQTLNRNHSQSLNAGFSILGSGQHVPPMKSASQPSMSGMSKQAGHASLLNNVWKSVYAQNPSTVQPQKFTPNILQNIIPFPSGKDVNSWNLHKVDDQSNKYVSAPPGSIVCSTNSQQSIYEDPVKINAMPQVPSVRMNVATKLDGAHYGQDPAERHLSGGNSAVSSSSHLTQQDFIKGIHVHNLSHNSQGRTPFQKVGSSSHDIGIHGQSPKSSDDVSQHSYSLLQQMQAMKGVDFDQGKWIGKKIKGTDAGSDASHINRKAAQMFTFGQNTLCSNVPANRESGINSNSPLSTDVKMLNFSSKESDDKSPSTSSHFFGKESGRHDLCGHSVTMVSKSGSMVGNERPSIGAQMAPSWFEQYGTYKSGQVLSMDERLKAAKAANQQLFLTKLSESRDNIPMLEQRHDTSNMASLGQGSSLNIVDADEVAPPLFQEHNIVLRPKKRKIAALEALPWHKEVSQRPRRQLSISMAELDWAESSKRLIEKVDDELAEDGQPLPQPQRRIILTTQLMQLLLPSIPAAILTADAISSYESLTYWVSRSALGDACSSISSSGNDLCVEAESRITMSGMLKTPDKDQEQIFSEVVENFIERSRKMESDFSRLDKRTSILDIRVECQEFERFSIINRLGKYHGRSQADCVDNLSTLESALRKIYPQRLVTALSLTGNLPEGVLCLSL